MSTWQIAFETSGRHGSVALLREDVLVKEIALAPQTGAALQTGTAPQAGTAQAIGPAVQQLVAELNRQGAGLGFVSVTRGPGSFTGLRIGVTAAKSLAFAIQCPIVACDTLTVMIWRARLRAIQAATVDLLPNSYPTPVNVTDDHAAVANDTPVDAAINAYRGQVFNRRETLSGKVLIETHVCDLDQWLTSLDRMRHHPNNDHLSRSGMIATGDAWENRRPLHQSILVEEPNHWYATAADVGRVAWQHYREGKTQDCFSLVPAYYRESAAVEKRSRSPKHP